MPENVPLEQQELEKLEELALYIGKPLEEALSRLLTGQLIEMLCCRDRKAWIEVIRDINKGIKGAYEVRTVSLGPLQREQIEKISSLLDKSRQQTMRAMVITQLISLEEEDVLAWGGITEDCTDFLENMLQEDPLSDGEMITLKTTGEYWAQF